ncbi:hypothetical protein K504DRAFT_493586 [Pleomassaria siparia CBS 279.74]|uniref:Nuclear membrane fusion protein Kar5 n=1 Tax=Pleomassaria siparia CBS 279.74 TaxID=1314801 RepID=A0A6G1K101_9PLEO|nr:hypothetical protein K504DRAFT_493586 [Pleomassaria siparia CBS 279.74]
MDSLGGNAVCLLLTMALLHGVAVAQIHSPSVTLDYGINADLASRLQAPPDNKQPELLSHALEILIPMRSAPTCNRLAALNLINDCKSLESESNSEMVLDEVKSEYAARLAVCELLGAKASVPRECGILVPSPQACIKGRFGFFSRQLNDDKECYPDSTHTQFDRCLGALNSKPQFWTSYSNAKQNAVVMCHASRNAIERDQSLGIYESLIEVIDRMASTLSSQIQENEARLIEQKIFMEEIRLLQEQSRQDMQINHRTTLSLFEVIKLKLHSVTGATDDAAETIRRAADEIRASHKDSRERLQGVYKDLVEESSLQSVALREQLRLDSDSARATLQSYHRDVANNHATLSKSLSTLQDQAEVSIEHLEHATRGVENLTKTVENLQTTVDAATDSIRTIATFGGTVANVRIWAAIAVCVLGLWKANHRFAGHLMAICGFIGFVSMTGIYGIFKASLVHAKAHLTMAHLTTVLPSSFFLPGVAIVCLLSAAIWSLIDSTYLYKYRDNQGTVGILPRIETPSQPGRSTTRE